MKYERRAFASRTRPALSIAQLTARRTCTSSKGGRARFIGMKKNHSLG